MFDNPTWPEVASKAIDTLKTSVDGLSAALQHVAPQAWDLAVRQAKIQGYGFLLGAAVSFSGTFACYKLIRHCMKIAEGQRGNDYRKQAAEGTIVAIVLSVFGAVGTAVVGVILTFQTLCYLGNPSYQAAVDILSRLGR